MNKRTLSTLFLILILAGSCRKTPSNDELQGTWTEQSTSSPSKLIFYNNDHMVFMHSPVIDTFTYTLDEKQAALFCDPVTNPTSGAKRFDLSWTSSKSVLTVMGLFPAGFGGVSHTDYKK